MEYEFQIEVNESKEILFKRITNYFVSNGFRINQSDDNSIEFGRGSLMLNKVTFNPLKWKSKIKVNLSKENILTSVFEINTSDQLVTIKEIELWESFIENYKRSIIFNNVFINENQIKTSETIKNSWVILFKIIIVLILLIILIGIVFFN